VTCAVEGPAVALVFAVALAFTVALVFAVVLAFAVALVFAVALAFLSVIPAGNLLLFLPLFNLAFRLAPGACQQS